MLATDGLDLRRDLQVIAQNEGIDRFGVAGAEPFPEVRVQIERRKQDGLAAGLQFTLEQPQISTDVTASFPWARSLLVAGRTYLPEAGHPGPPIAGMGRIARFAVGDAYVPLRRGLQKLADELNNRGWKAEVLCDDNRLVDRAAAVRAGLGWWGKNTMVLSPNLGPWMLFGSVVTDANLPHDQPMRRDCGTCQACLPACPTGALVAPGVLDATICLAALAQAPGVLPRNLRVPMGDRIYGCDDCIDACPPGARLAQQGSTSGNRIDLVDFLAASDRTILDRYQHMFIPERRPRYLRRNALVALGNSGTHDHLGILSGYVGHPDWLLRLHAAWAVGHIGGSASVSILNMARSFELHDQVIEEIDLTLKDHGVFGDLQPLLADDSISAR